MTTYSHSKIGTFESCPQKYKFQYVDRIRGDVESVESFLGTRVHEALEQLYRLVQNEAVPTESEILSFYDRQWETNWNPNVRIVEEGLQPEHYRNVGRRCIQDYYRRYHPFQQAKVIALERQVPILLDPAGRYRMIGLIDRVDKTAEGVFEIHDYKTNRSLPSQLEKDQDRQLALYEIGLRDFLGPANVQRVILVWHYLRFDHEIRSQRTEQELEELRAKMIAKIQEIEAATSANQFPPRESALCQWCEYRQLCPLWKHLYIAAQQAAQLTPLPDDGAALVNRLAELDRERKELAHQHDELTAELERVRQAIIRYAQERGVQRVFGADRIATIKRQIRWAIPSKTNQPDQYEQMLARLRESPYWPLVNDFSPNKLRELLDKPEAEPLRTLLAALVGRAEEWRVSLRKKQDDE